MTPARVILLCIAAGLFSAYVALTVGNQPRSPVAPVAHVSPDGPAIACLINGRVYTTRARCRP